MRSYASSSGLAQLKNFWRLFRYSRGPVGGPRDQSHPTVGEVQDIEAEFLRRTDLALGAAKVLEIGAGQIPTRLAYFACRTEAIGIDLEAVGGMFDMIGYARLLRRNGAIRLAKTLARRVLGFDARYRRSLRRSLGVKRLPPLRVIQMDAARMTFPGASFDLIYSADTFEHLPDPDAVVQGVVRILRPGGCCYLVFQPYCTEDGAHDLRIINNDRAGIPYWAHLRPQYRSLVQPAAYTNNLSMTQWRELFARLMPGATITCSMRSDPALIQALRDLRAGGELADYSDEELLLHRMVVVWQKAPAGGPASTRPR